MEALTPMTHESKLPPFKPPMVKTPPFKSPTRDDLILVMEQGWKYSSFLVFPCCLEKGLPSVMVVHRDWTLTSLKIRTARKDTPHVGANELTREANWLHRSQGVNVCGGGGLG